MNEDVKRATLGFGIAFTVILFVVTGSLVALVLATVFIVAGYTSKSKKGRR